MCCDSFDVVRFDLGPLLQGQTRIAKLKSSGRTGSENENGALKPNEIRDFESVQRYGKKFYASVQELHHQ